MATKRVYKTKTGTPGKQLAGADWWTAFVVYMQNSYAYQTACVRCSFIRRWLESGKTYMDFINSFGSAYQRINCITSIETFEKYAAQMGPNFYGRYFPDGYTKVKLPRTPPAREIPFIHPDDLKRMLDWMAENYPPVFHIMAQFVYFTGLRRDEFMNTTMDALFLQASKPYLLVPRGKGGKLRRVELTPMGIGLIINYLSIRQTILDFYDGPESPYLFVWRDGSKLTQNKLRKLNEALRAGYDFIGVDQPECPVHCLRHQFAKHLAMEYNGKPGLSIQVIQGLLGHGDVKLTERYCRVPTEHALETLEKFHPSRFWNQTMNIDPSDVEAALARALAGKLTAKPEKPKAEPEPEPEPIEKPRVKFNRRAVVMA